MLTPEQQNQLRETGAAPDAVAVIRFTADLDSENAKRRSRCVASRLLTVLESIQQFSSIVDTFVQSNPKVAALVWGSVKFALLVCRVTQHLLHILTQKKIASNFSSYFEKLSSFLMDIGKECPRYSEYYSIYSDSVGLQQALCSFYAHVINLCKESVIALQRTGNLQSFIIVP